MDSSRQPNRIENNTSIVGDITSEADFRIDGTLEGSITTSGKIVIGENGKIMGQMTCVNADIEGFFNGTLNVSDLLFLKKSAKVEGEIEIGKLSVEEGASLNASCQMRGNNVKTLSASDSNVNSEKTA